MTKEHPLAGFPTGSAVAISTAIAVAVLAMLGGPPFAAPASGQTFAGSTNVVEVEVPVQVVRDGQPVRGLTADDFELYEGRRKLTISGFRVADLAAPAGSPGTPEASRGAVPAAAQRRFLLLFDLAFSSPKSIVAAREAARGLVLKGLRPGDLVGVATYSAAHGAEIALGFTSDRRQVDAALDSLGAVRDPHGADPLRLVMAPGGKGGAAGRTSGPSLEADTARSNDLLDAQGGQLASLGKQSTRANEKAAVTALTRSETELARLLGSLPGRKQIVYFSEGFDSSFLTGSAAALPSAGGAGATDAGDVAALQQQDRANQDFYLTDSEATGGSTQALNAVERMLEELRRADCVIQAVDIGGLRAGGDQSAGARTAGKDSLLAMARGTGGELIQNTNDLAGAIGGVLERTSVTYVLSFQPEKGTPGAYHKVRVELKNAPRGTRIASRAGYYSPRSYGQLNPLEKLFDASSRLMAGTEAGSIPGAVLAAPFRAAGEKAYVPVQIEVDGPALLAGGAVPAGGAGGGGILPLEVYAYALDAGGAIQDFFYQSLSFDLDKAGAQLRQGGLRFFGHLDLAAGEYSVRTLIRNGASGAFSLRAIALTVPAFGKGPALLPPLFPDPGANRWALVHEAPRGNPGGGAPPAYPFVARKQPFYPAARPALAEGKEAPLALIGYDLGAAAVQTAARILDGDGKEVAAGGVRVLQREVGTDGAPDVLLAAFRPPRLPPGIYVLEVSVGAAGAAPAASRAPFVIPAVR
jgi:VWFA-related protein